MAVRSTSSFNSFTTETSNVRDVSTRLLNLEPDRTPLYVLTNNSKRKVNVFSPRIEFFEDADLVMVGTSNATVANSSVANTLTVLDATIFGVNDVVSVQAPSASSVQEELVQVTSVPTTNTIVVTRGFAGTALATVSATALLKILGVCQSEVGAIQNPRTPVKNPKTSGAQIFEWPMAISRTAAATKIYGDRPERARIQWLGMRRQKMEIENAGLFGVYSEQLNGTASMYTSMGVRNIITTYLTDAGGTTPCTMRVFLDWSRFAFRYGSPEKLLMAAPLIKEAMDYWAANKQLVKAEDKVFGVSLKRFVTSNGNWLIANNYNFDAGAADEALGIDLPSIEYCPLVNNGQNLDTRLYPDFDPTNPKLLRDLILTQAGWRVWHQARHARLYDFLDFA
jgi:hypothetical protein